MKNKTSSELKARRSGFTLIEVVMVLVLMIIIASISLPTLSGTLKGLQLKTGTRTVRRATKYARNMAIMREETLAVVLNKETMELYVGGYAEAQPNEADGELDQEVFKRLGWKDDDGSSASAGGIEKEVRHRLSDNLTVKDFEKDWIDEDDEYPDLCMIRFFPNGQCEWAKLELEDNKGDGVLLEIDPISAKMTSEFTQ